MWISTWLKKQYASRGDDDQARHHRIALDRRRDGENDIIDQDPNLRALIYWGHAPNSQTRGKEMIEAMKKLDLLVVIDPYPSATAAMARHGHGKDGVYLLPAATQFETSGSVTASNRSLQWREKVIEPLFESKPDQTIMYLFAKKFGFADQLVGKKDGKQNIAVVKRRAGDRGHHARIQPRLPGP